MNLRRGENIEAGRATEHQLAVGSPIGGVEVKLFALQTLGLVVVRHLEVVTYRCCIPRTL